MREQAEVQTQAVRHQTEVQSQLAKASDELAGTEERDCRA